MQNVQHNLVTKKIQVKTPMRHHYTPMERTKLKKNRTPTTKEIQRNCITLTLLT
jgi:hypothetical protein